MEEIKLVVGFLIFSSSVYGIDNSTITFCDNLSNDLVRDLCKYTTFLYNEIGSGTLLGILLFLVVIILAIKFPALFNFLNFLMEHIIEWFKERGKKEKNTINTNTEKLLKEIIQDINTLKGIEDKIQDILGNINILKEQIEKINSKNEDINTKITIIGKTTELNNNLTSDLGKEIEILKGSINTLNSIITNLLVNINKLLLILEKLDKIDKDIKKIKNVLNDLVD